MLPLQHLSSHCTVPPRGCIMLHEIWEEPCWVLRKVVLHCCHGGPQHLLPELSPFCVHLHAQGMLASGSGCCHMARMIRCLHVCNT